MRFAHWGLCLAAALCTALSAVPPAKARGLTLGFTDPVFMDAAAAPDWLVRARDSAAGIVRLDNNWRNLTPQQPTNGADPADPAYRWDSLDTAVKQAAATGLQILIGVERAPGWAEGADIPEDPQLQGAWKPNTRAFGELGHALATRYSGSYPDPHAPGATLPAVRYVQAWNEPNLQQHFAPQWRRSGGRLVRVSPSNYRNLLNSFYAGVKAANPATMVVAAGLSPFGDYTTGGARTPPAAFWRAVFCFANSALAPSPCPNPAHFDIFDHHPYSVGAPTRKALNTDDVTIPDMAKLIRPLRRAERTGRALPRKRHAVWASEVSWDSNPPDPDGVPEATRAKWIPETFKLLWQQGVDTVFWFLVRDSAPVPSYAATYQSGMYLRDGTAKAGQQSFRFPSVVRRQKRGVSVWARAPARGRVLLEGRLGNGWQPVWMQAVRAGEVVNRRIITPTAKLRIRFVASQR